MIADGNHLADETLGMFLRSKAGDLVLVSDCRSLGGLPEGSKLESYGEQLEVRDGAARYADGTLAGAVQPLWAGVQKIAGLQGFSFWDGLRLATVTPAKVLNLRGLGRISVGGRADLVLAGPDFSVRRVFYGGEEIFRAPGEPPLAGAAS
jgi:N-acetylglucosamine-6-phosphate deacetylase